LRHCPSSSRWPRAGGAREASAIPFCEGGAGAVPWGAREASPIPSCKGGAGAAPWGAREASPIPSCEGGTSGIIFLLIYNCDDVDKKYQQNVFFSKRGERCKINKKRRSSGHVKSNSTCPDDCQFYD